MKKIITIAMLLFSMASNAQGNLQFNRIVNFKSGNNYTVPTGKVLKIVSINALSNISVYQPLSNCNPTGAHWVSGYPSGYTAYYTDCQYNDLVYLTISNQNFSLSSISNRSFPQNQCSNCPPLSSTSVSNSTFNNLKLPIWLAASEVVTLAQIDGLLISAIEFNIIP